MALVSNAPWSLDDKVLTFVLTLCLPRTNLPFATLFGGALELGLHFGSTIFIFVYFYL